MPIIQTHLTNLIEENLIEFDIEYGNSEGFFSRALSESEHFQTNPQFDEPNVVSGSISGSSRTRISDRIKILTNGIIRDTKFQPREDAHLYDFVSRFVVLSDNRPATIADNKLWHTSSNIYYQYPTDHLVVPIGNSGWLRFKEKASKVPRGFERVFYIRDEKELNSGQKRWIVHHRFCAIPTRKNLIVRSCNPRLEGALPFQNLIPYAVKKRLYRIRETAKPNFPVMAISEAICDRDSIAQIGTKIDYWHDHL